MIAYPQREALHARQSRAKISRADFGYHCNSNANTFLLCKKRACGVVVRLAHRFAAMIA